MKKNIKIFLLLLGSIIYAQNKRPNIIIIHADDLGYHDLSYTGSKIYQTPNIDKLAQKSVFFTNAYANYPRCVPSRYSMMTGKYPVVNGDVPDDGFNLSDIPENQNFIKQFKKLNYHTAYFGKWHLGDEKSLTQIMGYDYSFAAGHAGSPSSYLYPFNKPKGVNAKVEKTKIPDIDEVSKEGDYLTDQLTNQFIKYIEDIRNQQPFLMVLAQYAVHQPLEAKEQDVQRNQLEIDQFNFGNTPEYIKEGAGRTKMRQDNATYAAMVENLDENVGKLMAYLQEKQLLENTIIVFSSDHGGLSNDGKNQRSLATSNAPLRAGKGWLYEGGIKVPLMMSWANQITPKQENHSVVMLMDVFPTLLDIVNSNTIKNIEGKSVKKLLFTKKTLANRTVYWHSSKARPGNTGDFKSSAIRKRNWKLIHFYEHDSLALYNLKNDIGENVNLSKGNTAKTKQLLKQLNQWKQKNKIVVTH